METGQLLVGTRWRVFLSDATIEHQDTECHVTEQRAAFGVPETAVPGIRLEFPDVVEQGPGKHQIEIGVTHLADCPADRCDLARVPEQPADLGMVTLDAGGTLLVQAPEIGIVVEQVEGAGKAGSRTSARQLSSSSQYGFTSATEGSSSRQSTDPRGRTRMEVTLSCRLPLCWPTSPITSATSPRVMPAIRGCSSAQKGAEASCP